MTLCGSISALWQQPMRFTNYKNRAFGTVGWLTTLAVLTLSAFLSGCVQMSLDDLGQPFPGNSRLRSR